LHDLGKASPAFQKYLELCANDPNHKHETVDHKGAGTLAIQAYAPGNDALIWAIAGHHGGLRDKHALKERMKRWRAEVPQNLTVPGLEQLPEPSLLALPDWAATDPLGFDFFTRLLSSTLFDADCLDTESHFDPELAEARQREFPGIDALAEKMTAAQHAIIGSSDDPMQPVRDRLALSCLDAASMPPGLFRIAAPTGSGKTRSALSFALRHASVNNLRRVISVAPYLSITDQTADSYRDLLGNEAILEHHSDAGRDDSEKGGEEHEIIWRRLASQTWDAPVIVTTAVQFFESLFSNKTSRMRKLHRIAKSVVILDEVQTLPTDLLLPILDMLRLLIAHAGVSVVLCTATQPPYERISKGITLPEATDLSRGLSEGVEIPIRVRFEWPDLDNPQDWDEIADQIRAESQVLAIANTRKDSLALLDALNDPEALYLSTLLCAEHRRAVIDEIKQKLPYGERCRVVSTQVVEAGVDLDFPVVMRVLGPLDRIIQAAGRCNREGALPEGGRMIVVNPIESSVPIGSYRTGKDITEGMLRHGMLDHDDPNNPATIERYFSQLLNRVALDRKYDERNDPRTIQDLRRDKDFEKVAETFRMIPNIEMSVLVPYLPPGADESPAIKLKDEVQRTIRAGRTIGRELTERLQPYLVSLPWYMGKDVIQDGQAVQLTDGLAWWIGEYHPIRGVVLDPGTLNNVWIM